jgi:tricorn protease
MERIWVTSLVFTAGLTSSLAAQEVTEASAPLTPNVASVDDTRMLAGPAVSDTHIAFEYADDLWVANLDGTGARRMTTHSGRELNPRFSPDGRLLAFSAQYDGNTDVYVVPVDGGVPERLTWHPGDDLVQEFTPDGEKVLFTSPRSVYTRRHRKLYTISIEGGHPDALPIPTAFKAAYSSDGSKIAYTPLYEAFRQWKNYRGGTATRIWIYDTGTHAVVQVPQPEGRCNDTDPMWIADSVYFVSDRNGEFNLFSFTPGDAGVQQLTQHEDFPILSASAGAGHIVYEQAGYLHLFHPENASSARLQVAVAADLMETRPRYIDGAQYIRGATVSPSGARAAFEYRGEIITLPVKKGDARNLTRTTGAHERSPAWSPDGKWIAYFSDASGDYELFIAPQGGRGEGRTFALNGAGFYDDPVWSPDSMKISFTDNSWTYYVLDVESGKIDEIAQEPLYGPMKTMHHAWSPDSRWIAYTLNTQTYFKQVHLYDVENKKSQAITDGLSDVAEPVFDSGGKYLYFAASTNAGPVNMWFAMSNADMEQTSALFLAVLARDTPSPLARESDEEEVDEDDAEEAEAEEDAAEPETELVTIDLDGISQRIIALPTGTAAFSNLAPGKEGQLYYLKGEAGPAFGNGGGKLARFDLAEREETVLMDKASGFAVAAKHDQLLVAADGQFWIAAANGKIDASKGKLAVDKLQVKIDPRSEWAQIFDEAWRINRDYFYDPNYHGADWPAVRNKYAQFLPYLATRSDLNRVIGWVCSELSVGHSRNGGGDTLIDTDDVPGGLLGADFEVDGDRYRFAKVYGGLNWNPDLRAPLTEPGVGVQAGEYLLAVEGRDLRAPENLFSRFENTSGKIVEITIGSETDGSDARTVEIVPIANEAALRNRDWVEGNIARVTEATDGRVAYVYVPNTTNMGHTYFKRYFFPQADREAIIVDERHNGGGQVADYYIDILRRPYISNWAMRYGADLVTPQGAILGPKVMLIDETAGSGGDLLPWMFRELELGQLIGRPTWGGLVGTLGFPALMDGGQVTAPNLAIWTEAGFIVENVGVPPDIEVEQLPADVIAGRDPQLEMAIEVILQELAENPPPNPMRPPYPTRVRK